MQLAISSLDLAIVIVYLVGVVLFGLWIGRRQRGISDYLLGDRDLPTWLVLLSIVATETSTATFLSVPGLSYRGDMSFLQLAFGYVLGRYAVVRLLLPLYFRGELFTAYQVLSQRFGGATKQTASLMFLVTRSLADGLRLFLAALVLKAILFPGATTAEGFDYQLSIAVVVMGTATILYTFFGGMKAVVWTDAVQFAVYIAGALLALRIILNLLPDGWNSVAEYGRMHGKFTVINPVLDFTKEYTLWAGLAGGAFLSLGSHGADQLMVQRYLSARNQQAAGRALILSGWVVVAQFALFLVLGIALACFYQGRSFQTADAVFTTFIVEQMPQGVRGITLAAVFAAAMSTLSSSLNSLAAAAINDFYLPWSGASPNQRRVLWITRGLTICFGLVQMGVGIGGQFLYQSVVANVLAIAGFTTGIVLGIFFLAIASRRANQAAALTAVLGGLAGMAYIKFRTPLAWPWFTLVGSLGTLALGLAVSRLTAGSRKPSEDDLA